MRAGDAHPIHGSFTFDVTAPPSTTTPLAPGSSATPGRRQARIPRRQQRAPRPWTTSSRPRRQRWIRCGRSVRTGPVDARDDLRRRCARGTGMDGSRTTRQLEPNSPGSGSRVSSSSPAGSSSSSHWRTRSGCVVWRVVRDSSGRGDGTEDGRRPRGAVRFSPSGRSDLCPDAVVVCCGCHGPPDRCRGRPGSRQLGHGEHRWTPSTSAALGLAGYALVLVSFWFDGHTATKDRGRAPIACFVHLGAAAVWGGGVFR